MLMLLQNKSLFFRRTVVVLLALWCASSFADVSPNLRELRLYGFETPRAGKLFPHWAMCTGRLRRTRQAARDGQYGGRIDFADINGRNNLLVAWDYVPVHPIARGARELSVWLRTPLKHVPVFCRVWDSRGRWFGCRKIVAEAERFRRVRFPFGDFQGVGRYKGAKISWPILQVRIGVVPPGCDGWFELDSLTLATGAAEDAQPSFEAEIGMEAFGNLYPPQSEPAWTLYLRSLSGDTPPRRFGGNYRVNDWAGTAVDKGKLREMTIGGHQAVKQTLPLKNGARVGAFQIQANLADRHEERIRTSARAWCGILPTKEVKPSGWVGTCMHWDHGWGRGEMRVLDILAQAGIGVVRQDVSWPTWEPAPRQYEPQPIFDRFAKELNRRGIEWDLKLYRHNTAYANPLDPDAHARFAAWLAKHYKRKVRYFEIWNEPANCFFRAQYGQDKTGRGIWVDQFVEFTNKTARAIRQARPDAKVLVASEDIFFRLQEMLEKGIGKHADMLAIHTYTKRTVRPETGEFLGDGLAAMRAYCRRYDAPQRVAITESGWTTCSGKDITHLGWAGSFVQTTYEQQASYLIRMYLLAHAAGAEFVTNYDFMNDGPRRDYTEHNFGIVHQDYSPKPALLAIAAMTRLLGESHFENDLSPQPEKARVQVYRTKGKQRVIAAWAIQDKYAIRLKTKVGQVELVDLMGNRTEIPTKNGVVSLNLREIPMYVIVSGNVSRGK